jgi:hypothetical protein
VRTARPVRPTPELLAGRPALGAAARGAVQLARHLDVATSRRTDRVPATASGAAPALSVGPAPRSPAPSALPWGVWPTADEAEADDHVAVLGDALASYARMLRAKRGEPAAPPARGIPLIIRRAGGTAGGPRRGPGGLVRSMVPIDQPVAAPVPDRPSAVAARPQPLPGRPSASPARQTLTPRRPGGR